MTNSDSLDNITLNSDEIQSIKRFENNYYNHKNDIIQNGGMNVQETTISLIMDILREIILGINIQKELNDLDIAIRKQFKSPEVQFVPIKKPGEVQKAQISPSSPSSLSSTSSAIPTLSKAEKDAVTKADKVKKEAAKNADKVKKEAVKAAKKAAENADKAAKKAAKVTSPKKSFFNWDKKGGSYDINKLEKDIERLSNYYVLSQNGGNDKLSFIIKKKLNKKIAKLKILEGGNLSKEVIKANANLKKKLLDPILKGIKGKPFEPVIKLPLQTIIDSFDIITILTRNIQNTPQKGGNNINKLKKNIERLYNCYILSLNQNGGENNELSFLIKKKLDKKIDELNDLEGGLLFRDKQYNNNNEGDIKKDLLNYIESGLKAIPNLENELKKIYDGIIDIKNKTVNTIKGVGDYISKDLGNNILGKIGDPLLSVGRDIDKKLRLTHYALTAKKN